MELNCTVLAKAEGVEKADECVTIVGRNVFRDVTENPDMEHLAIFLLARSCAGL
jgi:hypothetical protein